MRHAEGGNTRPRGLVLPVLILLVSTLGVSCASGPYPVTRAGDARSSEPWLEGEPCSPAARRDDGGLRVEDVVAGTGKVAEAGDTVRAHYKVELPGGAPIRDSRASGPPIEIILGSSRMICGFEKGLIGMRSGGVRRIFVPWRLAFGENGRLPDVEPRSDLVFVVDLFSPSDPASSGGGGGAGRAPAGARGGRRGR